MRDVEASQRRRADPPSRATATPAALAQPILERDAELAAIERLLEHSSRGEGGMLVIEGRPGVGKTVLLEAAAARAGAFGHEVAHARAGELEAELGFGVVRQLLEPAAAAATIAERDELFAGAAGHARAIVDPTAPASEAATSEPSAAALHGLFWLCSNLAERRPLLLAIDDAHWADSASLGFVAYLARRLEGLAAAVVLAARPAGPGPATHLLAAVRDAPRLELASPGPLPAHASADLVRTAFTTEPSAAFVEACHAASGGNPFYLKEILAVARAEGLDPDDSSAGRVGDLGPETIRRELAARVTPLGPAAVALARAMAVLGASSQLRHAAALAGLHRDVAASAADALERADLVTADRPLRFSHPIIRTSFYQGILTGECESLHRRAARMLGGEQADSDQVATHLLRTEGRDDPRVVEALALAARDALARGAPDAAVSYLRRALSEPPPTHERGQTLLELGRAEAVLHAPEAVEHLREAIAALDDPASRARAAMPLGQLLMFSNAVQEGYAVMTATIDELEQLDRELALNCEAALMAVALLEPSTHGVIASRLAAHRFGDTLEGRTPGERAILARAAVHSAQTGDSAERTARLATRAWGDGALTTDWTEGSHSMAAVRAMAVAGRLREGEDAVSAGISVARAQGSINGFCLHAILRSEIRYCRGDVDGSVADRAAVLEVLDSDRPDHLYTAFLQFACWSLIELEDTAQAARLLATSDIPETPPDGFLYNGVLLFRGLLRRLDGDLEGALRDLTAAGEREEAWGQRNPACLSVPWRSSIALIHISLGDEAGARQLIDEELRLANAYRAPRAIGMSLRAAGLVENGERRVARLRESVAVLDGSGAVLEHARALTDLGCALRHAGSRSEGRGTLRVALDLADRCGATVLADRAREELLAAGGRPRRRRLSGSEALTSSEGRVARMAAEGRSNREIAQDLFVTVKTVEGHLGRAYAKLEISSREEIESALSAPTRQRAEARC